MEIRVDQKTYFNNKISGKKYDRYLEVMEEIEERQNGKDAKDFSKEDIQLIRETVAMFYDNKFTADDLYEYCDVADIIYAFFEIRLEIDKKISRKAEKVAKNLQGAPKTQKRKKEKS